MITQLKYYSFAFLLCFFAKLKTHGTVDLKEKEIHKLERAILLLSNYHKLDSAFSLSKNAYTYFEENDNYNLTYYALSIMGEASTNMGEIDEGILYLKMCEMMLNKHPDQIKNSFYTKSKFEPLLTLAKHYRDESPSTHLFYLEKAILLAKKSNNIELLFKAYQNYMYYYDTSSQFPKALKMAFLTNKLALNLKDTSKIGISYVDIADLYSKMGEHQKSDSILSIADYYFNNQVNSSNYCFSCWSLTARGNNYLRWGKFDSAQKYLTYAIDTFTDLNYPEAIALSKARLSMLYFKKGDFKKGQILKKEALELKGTGSQVTHINILKNLIEFYTNIGLTDSASAIRIELSAYNDSVMQKNVERQVEVLRKLEKIEKREQELEKSKIEREKEIREHNSWQNQLIAISIIVLFVIVLIVFAIRNKLVYNKKLKEKQELIEWQKVMVEDQLIGAKEQQKEIEMLHNEATKRIEFARSIQNTIIPTYNQLKSALIDFFLLYLPRDIVSGDFYWLKEIEDGQLFAVADCTGHGVPGAMVSLIGSDGLNECVDDFNLKTPSEILDKLSELIEKRFTNENGFINDGMDIALCKISKDRKTLEYSGANNPLWLVRNNEITIYKADKQPIGLFENRTKFTNYTINIENGDVIYIFSDGFADQFGGENNKKFKVSKLKELVINNHKLSTSEQHQIFMQIFSDWKGSEEQVDDVTLMCVKL